MPSAEGLSAAFLLAGTRRNRNSPKKGDQDGQTMGGKGIHSNPKTANAKALWPQTLNPHAGALEIKAREKWGLSKGNTKTHGNFFYPGLPSNEIRDRYHCTQLRQVFVSLS